MAFFNRSISFNLSVSDEAGNVANVEFSGNIHIRFNVVKNQKDSSNTATVDVYNIASTNRTFLNTNAIGRSSATIFAGYGNDKQLLFAGDIVEIKDQLSGADLVTSFELATGFNAKQTGEVSMTYDKGTSLKSMISDLSKLVKGLESIDLSSMKDNDIYIRGISVSANPLDFIMRELKSKGYKPVLTDGKIKVKKGNEPTGRVLSIDGTSGMIDIPEQVTITEDENEVVEDAVNEESAESQGLAKPTKAKIGYRVKTLLNGGIAIGDAIILSSKRLGIKNLRLYVDNITHEGSNFDTEYYTTVEAFLLDTSELLSDKQIAEGSG